MTKSNEKFEKSDQMGFPPKGEAAAVQGVLPGDLDEYEFSRTEANPADPFEGDDPSYMTRQRDTK